MSAALWVTVTQTLLLQTTERLLKSISSSKLEPAFMTDGVMSVNFIVYRDARRYEPVQGLCDLEYDFVGQAL